MQFQNQSPTYDIGAIKEFFDIRIHELLPQRRTRQQRINDFFAEYENLKVCFELGEINEIMNELEHKARRRMRYIHDHMKNCGECLSEQIKSGMLIELPDYWQLQRQSGGGRYPKLHYQVN